MIASRAQDLVFYGKTVCGKTHLAIGLGMKTIDMGLGVRFHQTAELVPPAGQGQTRRHPRDDAQGHRPGRPDYTGRVRLRALRHRRGGACPDQIIAGSYERRSIIFTTNIESGKWGTVFADDKLAAAIIDRIVHHGRSFEFTGQSRRAGEALMFGRNAAGQPRK